MPLANIVNLTSDIKRILDEKPADTEIVARMWSDAIGSWLTTVTAPPAESLTSAALSQVMFEKLNVQLGFDEGDPDFLQLLNNALSDAADLVVNDPAVLLLEQTQGLVAVAPVSQVTFATVLPVGILAGDSGNSAIAAAISAELLAWGVTGVYAGLPWV